MPSMKHFLAITLFVFLGTAQAQGVPVAAFHAHDYGVWNLEPRGDREVWVIVHNLDDGKQTGIYHVEVIAKKRDDPRWKIERLVRHLAVSRQALLDSIVSPRLSGQVYPEQYHDAYRKWQESTTRPVCTTSLSDCIDGRR